MPAFARQHYVDAIHAYFDRMDAFDLDGFCALLTDDCTITCETELGTGHLADKEAMRTFFAGLRERTGTMVHAVHRVIADPEENRAACDLTYRNDRANGDVFEVYVGNQFDFAPDGRIARVRFWLGRPRGTGTTSRRPAAEPSAEVVVALARARARALDELGPRQHGQAPRREPGGVGGQPRRRRPDRGAGEVDRLPGGLGGGHRSLLSLAGGQSSPCALVKAGSPPNSCSFSRCIQRCSEATFETSSRIAPSPSSPFRLTKRQRKWSTQAVSAPVGS